MKIALTFKTPDIVDDAIKEIERDNMMPWPSGFEYIDDEEIKAAQDTWREELKEKIKRHIQWGEYLTVYYNTETDKLELS